MGTQPEGRRASRRSDWSKDPRVLLAYDFLTPIGWRRGTGKTLQEARRDCIRACGQIPTRFKFEWYLLPFDDQPKPDNPWAQPYIGGE